MARLVLFVLVLALAVPASGAVGAPAATVASVTDGDTLVLTTGQRIRLLQIDAPEAGECFGAEARTALLRLAPLGVSVALERDRQLDQVDRYGRLLRYLRRGAVNVNVELARRGAAAPYFYRGERGRYAGRLLSAAQAAKRAGVGLWGASPATVLDPERQVDTGRCLP